jgi:outer membrane protein TolC
VDRTPQLVAYHNTIIDRDRRRRAMVSLQRRIGAEARRAARNYRRLLRSLEVARSQVEFAEKELEVATFRYQRGMANNLDVVNVEVNLLAVRSRLIGVQAESAVARLQLRAILGTLDPYQFIQEEAGTHDGSSVVEAEAVLGEARPRAHRPPS